MRTVRSKGTIVGISIDVFSKVDRGFRFSIRVNCNISDVMAKFHQIKNGSVHRLWDKITEGVSVLLFKAVYILIFHELIGMSRFDRPEIPNTLHHPLEDFSVSINVRLVILEGR